jgi:hypothetical protein
LLSLFSNLVFATNSKISRADKFDTFQSGKMWSKVWIVSREVSICKTLYSVGLYLKKFAWTAKRKRGKEGKRERGKGKKGKRERGKEGKR